MGKVSEYITVAVSRWGGLAILIVLAACLLAGLYCAGNIIGQGGLTRLVTGVMGFLGFLVGIIMVGLAMANEIKAIRNGLK